ncbi:MAG TPA: two-component regulator propeller domain-containing protein [Pyrinomonadaceae bacterium]|nr:two-component regulator propeller domain-containing protein [Pyrinomonadaceae bacterium]
MPESKLIWKKVGTKSNTALTICVIVFFVQITIFALDPNRKIGQFHHTSWTAKNGAPSQISDLAQTSDGYLWIGSALGLFRFDGITFELFQPPDGTVLPSNNIYSLMPTPDGGLWISFRPTGIGFLKDGKLRIFSRPEELPKSQVYSFARTNDGKIWAGTHTGLALYNGEGWTEIGAEMDFQPSRVRKMFVDRDGTLWISTDETMYFLPSGAVKFEHFSTDGSYALDIAQAKDGRLWVSKFPKQISPLNSPNSPQNSANPEITTDAWEIIFDRDGSLWTASSTQIKRIFPERFSSEKVSENDSRVEVFRESDGLSGSFVNNILEDREGNIWVGTTKGLDRFRYSPVIPVYLPVGVQKLTLAAVENGDIWAGSASADVFVHIQDGQNDVLMNKPKEIYASSYYRDEKNVYWWGMQGGILRQNGDERQFFPQPKDLKPDWIWEVFRGEDDGGFWVNFGDEGLIYFKDGVWERRKMPEGLPNRGPSASFEDSQKRIWLGYTENRVFVLDGENVRGFTSTEGLEIGRIKVIRGRNSTIWCGGETGLAVLIGEKFHTVKADGKSFGAVSGIVETENGDLWLNEIHGIVQISADEVRKLLADPEYSVKFRLFNYEDNLPGGTQMNFTVSTAIEATDKRLWFATDNGLAVIDPQKIEKNNVPPPVVIKSVTIGENVRQAVPEMVFPAGTTNLQISYTALSFSIPERVHFKFRLENFENDWREAGTRRDAFYTNLSPGKYRFHVIAANNDGVWNENGAILEFEILPLFYQTRWFLILCLAILGGILILGFVWRVRQVQSRLKMSYEERLSERTRIAQDLHDTLLQGMVGVSMQFDVVVNKIPAESPVKSRLERMREMMKQIIDEGRNTVNGLRSPEKNESLPDLEKDFYRINRKLNDGEKTNFKVITNGIYKPICPLIHDEIYFICHEALANAFRHSQATEIKAEIDYGKNELTVRIKDNGFGIEPLILKNGRKDHWGLAGMKERAEKIGANLQIESQNGIGTEIELTISNNIAFETEKKHFYKFWFNKFKPAKVIEAEFESKNSNEK